MDDRTKQALLERFRAYLDGAESAQPDLPETVDEAAEETADLYAIFVELAGLRTEVRTESRLVKDALDQFRGVFDTLRSLGMRVLRRLGADEGTSAASRAHAALRTPHVGTATLETAVTRPHGVRAVAAPAPSELAIAGVGG